MNSRAVYFSDMTGRSTRPVELTPEERANFLELVDRQMIKLGYDKANYLTAQSEVLTERDFMIYINI